MFDSVSKVLAYVDKNELYPDLRIIEGAAEPEVTIDGRKILMFSSNNYLGLATHPILIETALEATKKYGVGSDGSRLLSGNLQIHKDFEKAIANFEGGDDAVVWPSGYAANIGTISALLDAPKVDGFALFKQDPLVLSDELNHASIIDGIRLSRAKKIVYKHCDLFDLESKLKNFRSREKLVITDSVFSMDGDIAPLDKIVGLCKQYNAMLMIDEAHATGVLGERGHGSLDYFHLKAQKDVDVVLGTCSKALACTGGFVVGSEDLVRYLRVASRSYMFSTAMTPAASAVLIKALDIIEKEPKRHKQLWELSNYLRGKFHEIGFDTLGSQTQIIPILIGDEKLSVEFSRKMFEKGVFSPCVRWPAVAKGKARIRFTLMTTHTKEQIDYLLKCCGEIVKELGLTL
ncbi:MAG: 8-amino-7-oxononanoate synthase [Candidatus Pacebacteria bacterium]|nr:8-amino-7-oxononanoate synthase [Candidatus Paceibacterota bacterium]